MLLIATLVLFLQDEDPRPQALKDLDIARQEIQILQLFNEINLKADQIEKLLDCADQANKIMKDFAEDNRVVLDDARKALADAKAVLEKGGTLSEDAKLSFAEIDRSLKERTKEMGTQLQPLAEKLRGALEERQLRRLILFGKPDPMRNELRKGLAQIRILSDDDFDSKIPQAISQRVEKLGGLSQDEIETERDRIIGILKETRTVSDEDFEKKLEEYVDRIAMEGKTGEAIRKASPQGADAEKQLGKFIMSPRVQSLLKRRLELLKSQ